MRKVSKTVVSAFLRREPCKVKNTQTNGTTLFLFGKPIAWHESRCDEPGIVWTMAGWPTATTRDRLNTLFDLAGWPLGLHQHDYSQYLRTINHSHPISAHSENWHPLELRS